MTPEERSVITNGIWLCRRCAKLIDTDVPRYSVDLLYKWKREHEAEQAAAIGADPSVLEERRRIVMMFASESPAATQLAVDKPEYWEFLLIIELIRAKLSPVRQRLHEIDEGFTYRPALLIDLQDTPKWIRVQIASLDSLVAVLKAIVTRKLPSSWGPPGVPGDSQEILRATTLLRDACEGLLDWEQEVARARFPDDLDDLRQRMRRWTHRLLAEMEKIPEMMSAPLRERAQGTHAINLVFETPDDLEAVCTEFRKRFLESHG
jgi:hypothetical protein